MPKKVTTADFIARAEAVHGKGTYDYSKTEYVQARGKVAIRCPEHGVRRRGPRMLALDLRSTPSGTDQPRIYSPLLPSLGGDICTSHSTIAPS